MADCANCPRAEAACGQRWVALRRDIPLSGILIVDKPTGITSHDVVDAVRRMAGQRKVGHAGTLDPMASGVLLICLGQATRVAEYLMAGQKRYRATITLGAATDTYDALGRVISSGGRTDFSLIEIEAALARFVGHIDQVPPMYSALKQEGQPLYRLARQGRTVDRQPRGVEIEQIELLDWTTPSLTVDVTCSPGTYVRSLANDLGEHLGSGATLTGLVRLASGRFTLGEAVSLERLEEAFQYDQYDRYLLPLDEALLDWPAMIVSAEGARQIVHGQAVPSGPSANNGDEIRLCRAYSLDGDFLAVMSYDAVSGNWHPHKVFSQA